MAFHGYAAGLPERGGWVWFIGSSSLASERRCRTACYILNRDEAVDPHLKAGLTSLLRGRRCMGRAFQERLTFTGPTGGFNEEDIARTGRFSCSFAERLRETGEQGTGSRRTGSTRGRCAGARSGPDGSCASSRGPGAGSRGKGWRGRGRLGQEGLWQ